MDSMLTNGIDRGRWSFYGDFELQKLYCKSDEIENGLQELDLKTSFIRFKLTMNCRNTRQIGQEVNFLTESKNQLRFLNDIDGPPVDYLIYKSSDEHLEKLQLLLENLIKVKKIEKSKITILSPRKYEKSIVSCIDNKKCKIRQYSIGDHKEISFSTVHSFKGLENSVIIICDLETINNKELLYTGLSRAKTKLYIFESKTADKERKSVIRRSFQ
jgi:DNA helicase IV